MIVYQLIEAIDIMEALDELHTTEAGALHSVHMLFEGRKHSVTCSRSGSSLTDDIMYVEAQGEGEPSRKFCISAREVLG